MTALKHIATLGPVGYIPFAPGTMGSAVAVVFVYAIKPTLFFHIGLTVFFTVLGVVASQAAEHAFKRKDPSHVVIDEFAGYLIATVAMPATEGYLFIAFILFRILDILKPPPARGLQRLRGGLGVMLDDIVAGAMTNLLLWAWRLIAHA